MDYKDHLYRLLRAGPAKTKKLIIAVADYAEGQITEIPLPLEMAFQCKRWGTLPLAGGLEDQPIKELTEMETALNIHDLYRTYIENSTNKAWWKVNINILKSITRINHLRATGNWPD